MNGLRGQPPTFEPTSQFLTKPDHRFYKKQEQLHFPKPAKEASYIPPEPVSPIFKNRDGSKGVEGTRWESEAEYSSVIEKEGDEGDEEFEEDDESEGFGDSEYEGSIEEEIPTPPSEIEQTGEAPVPNFGNPPSLVELCLRVYAKNFDTLWKSAKYMTPNNLKALSQMIDLDSTDVGKAARALHDDAFWKRWARHKWNGYHKPWSHGRCWKTYFLEKYLAEFLAKLDPDRCNIKQVRRLTRRIKQWIYTLDIKQLSQPPWPAAVDVASSTDSEEDSDLDGILSEFTLSEYLNRNINFFPMPESTIRFPLLPVFELLTNLTHLTFSFGYHNFNMHKELKFSKVTDEDAANLAQALATCNNLYCFKLTRSKITPSQLESIIFGLEELAFFKEAEFSHLFLNDSHMVSITGLLLLKRNMRVLCLKNNDIGSDGFIRLLHVIILKDCKLRILDVSMNPIGDPGGVAIAALLAKKKRYLKRLFMSGTGLTYISGYNFGIVLYFNKCLEVLDLSVNQFSDFAAEALMKGMEHNYKLKRIDLRECGIPFTTVREMERMCFKNAETERKQKYAFPTVHPRDFWSGFNELDAELASDLKLEKSEDKLKKDEEEVTRELLQIFVWATAQMKPRNKYLLIRDIHSLMKKTSFVTGFDVVVDKLILTKQKELILKSRIDATREKEERFEGSTFMIDFSYQEFMKRTNEKLKMDFIELEALQVLKDVNRCGRIDELFKTVKSNRIDYILKRIGRHLENDIEMITSAGIELPFAKSWYKGFADHEPVEEGLEDGIEDEMKGEDDDVLDEDHIDVFSARSCSKSTMDLSRTSLMKPRHTLDDVHETKKQSGSIVEYKSSKTLSMSIRKEKTMSIAVPFFKSQVIGREKALSRAASSILVDNDDPENTRKKSTAFFSLDNYQAFVTARDLALAIRSKFRCWPKDGPPKFPEVIPYEIIKDCNESLPETESEKEEDFPYWLSQWLQKY